MSKILTKGIIAGSNRSLSIPEFALVFGGDPLTFDSEFLTFTV